MSPRWGLNRVNVSGYKDVAPTALRLGWRSPRRSREAMERKNIRQVLDWASPLALSALTRFTLCQKTKAPLWGGVELLVTPRGVTLVAWRLRHDGDRPR